MKNWFELWWLKFVLFLSFVFGPRCLLLGKLLFKCDRPWIVGIEVRVTYCVSMNFLEALGHNLKGYANMTLFSTNLSFCGTEGLFCLWLCFQALP